VTEPFSDPLAKLEDILRDSHLEFERSVFDDNTELISALLDPESDLRLDIITTKDGDGLDLKMVVFVDDVTDENALAQLMNTLELNFITLLGRFAYNSQINSVVYVLDYPLALLDIEVFQRIIDEYQYFSNLYFERLYGEKQPDPDQVGHD
jgi:hypothetical protein